MTVISFDLLQEYRSKTFRTAPGLRIKTKEEAISYVNQIGFVFFWPIKDILLPSLWTAAAGDRPVADAHDDPGHVTWGWKDSLLGQHQWYYGKVLRKKSTMISLSVAPYFYALSENYGSPEEDYLTQYEQGKLTLESKAVYEALLDGGPLDTIALRKAAHLTSRESDARFNKALTDLQVDFKIIPVGVSQAGAWNYAFIYDILPRHYPEIVEGARFIGEEDARQRLAERYLEAVGGAQLRDLTRLFGWQPTQAQRVLDRLIKAGTIKTGVEIRSPENQPSKSRVHSDWFVLSKLS